jgi:hypothetical protein
MKKLNVKIENYIMDEDNLLELNHFIMICTMAENEQELRDILSNLKKDGSFECLEEKGVRYGFGHNHFWMSELQNRDEWVRILFIDFSQ